MKWYGKFRNKSLFWQILLSYLLLLAVFVCALITLYGISSDNLRKEIRDRSYIILQKTQQEMEDRVIAARTVMEKIYMDDTFQNVVWKDSWESVGMKEQYTMKTALAKWRTQDMADIFVMYAHSGRVVSGAYASTQAETYFQEYYSLDRSLSVHDSSYEAWKEAAENGSGAIAFPEVATGGNTIFLTMRYPAYRTTPEKAVITVVLRPAQVEEALCGVSDGCLMIYNADGHLLASSGTPIEDFCPNPEKGNYYKERIGGKPYVVQVSNSNQTGFQYIHVIPESVFWSKQKRYLHTALIGMIIFLGIGGELIFLLSRVNYKPWRNLMTVVNDGTENRNHRETIAENAYIQEAFRTVISERLDLYQQMQAGKVLNMENLLLQFLRCESNGERFFEAVIENRVMPLEHTFLLVEFWIESWDQDKIPDLNHPNVILTVKEQISSLIENIGSEVQCCFVAQWNRRVLIVLVEVIDEAEYDPFVEGISQVRAILEKSNGVTATAMISMTEKEKEKIPRLFDQLHQCEEYRTVLGRGGTISFPAVSHRSFCYRSNGSYVRNYLLDWMEQRGKKQNELEAVRGVIDGTMDEATADARSFRLLRDDISDGMRQLASEMGVRSEEWEKQLQILIYAETWLEFKLQAADMLKVLRQLKEKNDFENDFINRAYTYVNSHYQNPDLNLNFLADEFGVSAQYLSRSFKERYQTGIVDFIAGIRVSHAKKELENCGDSVEAIAGRNGFLSSASFIRTFKKFTGMTPGAYREHYPE